MVLKYFWLWSFLAEILFIQPTIQPIIILLALFRVTIIFRPQRPLSNVCYHSIYYHVFWYRYLYVLQVCKTCPAGYSCSDSASLPQPCTQGTYSSEGSTDCTDCPASQSCLDPSEPPINCDSGEYSLEVNYGY